MSFPIFYPDNWELADVKLYRAAQVSRYIWLAGYKCELKNFLNSDSLEEHNVYIVHLMYKKNSYEI